MSTKNDVWSGMGKLGCFCKFDESGKLLGKDDGDFMEPFVYFEKKKSKSTGKMYSKGWFSAEKSGMATYFVAKDNPQYVKAWNADGTTCYTPKATMVKKAREMAKFMFSQPYTKKEKAKNVAPVAQTVTKAQNTEIAEIRAELSELKDMFKAFMSK